MSLKKLFAANTASQNENADVNMDGLHNSLDLIKMRRFLLDVDKRYPISAKEYIFGDDAFNSMKKQGSGNFYAMYLDSSNHGASFPVQNLKQMNYLSRNPIQWMPDDGETTYMYLRSSGETALQANKSLAVKWVAPETGTYYIDSFFYGGTRDVSAANDDGIAFGVYKNTERLAYINKTSAFWIEKEDIQKDLSQHVIKTVEMNKGDALYFTADPKGVIKSADLPKIYIKISNSEEEGFNYSLGMSDFSGTNPDDVIAYSAPEQYPQYDVQYIVKINGKDVGVFSDKNGWEKSVNFATFEMRENSTVKVEVTPLFTYRKYKILPDKYGIESNRSGNTIKFDLSDPKAKLSFVFEDNYKNTTLHLFANPIDDNAPTASSENIIYFGPGYHLLSETIKPKHNQTVYIANGAVVNGSIYVEGMENVTICGSGILVRDEDSASGFRGIRLIECLGVKISGITVNINMSMEWTTEIRRCADVTITNYKVVSPEWASTDGIDIINSQRITVDDCFLRANDDTITLKGLEWDGVSTSTLNAGIKGIRVNNCILWNECNSAMVVGEETLAKYYSDIKFTDIDVLFSYDDIYYHEALYERAVISIISGHGCTFEDIHWENIRVNMCERLVCFAFIDEFYKIPVGEYCQALPGYMKNITVKNVTSNSTSDNIYANQIFLKGWNADKTISNITFDNVIIKGEKLTAGSPLIVKNEYVSEITV
ncbi:MAG: hypothetical protein GX957_14260, partial [Clostridiaceae bacterium]|nr:hypothetical protein [Clostridiaceae bacterium]